MVNHPRSMRQRPWMSLISRKLNKIAEVMVRKMTCQRSLLTIGMLRLSKKIRQMQLRTTDRQASDLTR